MADQRSRGGKKEGTQNPQNSEKHQGVHTGAQQTGQHEADQGRTKDNPPRGPQPGGQK